MIEVPLAVAVPWAAWLDTATLVGAPPERLSVIGLPADPKATVAEAAPAIGAWTTVMLTVAGAELPRTLVAV